MGVNKYARTFPMASYRKGVITEKKRGVKKYENTLLFLQVRN